MNITSLDGKISFLRDLYAGIDVRQRGMSYRVKVYLKTGAVLKSDYLTSEEEAMKYAGDLIDKAAAFPKSEEKAEHAIPEREIISTSDGKISFLRDHYITHSYWGEEQEKFFFDVVLAAPLNSNTYITRAVYSSLKDAAKAFEEISKQLNK